MDIVARYHLSSRERVFLLFAVKHRNMHRSPDRPANMLNWAKRVVTSPFESPRVPPEVVVETLRYVVCVCCRREGSLCLDLVCDLVVKGVFLISLLCT